MNQRCVVVEDLKDGRARFRCLSGHTFVRQAVDRRKGQSRFLKPGYTAVVQMLLKYWKDGVAMRCPECAKARVS